MTTERCVCVLGWESCKVHGTCARSHVPHRACEHCGYGHENEKCSLCHQPLAVTANIVRDPEWGFTHRRCQAGIKSDG